MSSYFKQNLKEGEEPLLILRQHGATFLWPLVRTIIMVGVSVPLIPYAFDYLWAAIAIIAWWVFIAVWAVLSWLTWYFNITLVTSQRIVAIEQAGPFTRKVREATHDKVVEVTFQIKGLVATIFGYGNVDVYFAGQDKSITIKAVISPEVVKDQLLRIQEYTKQADSQKAGITIEKLVKLIQDTKAEHKVPVHVNKFKNNSDE